MAYTDKLVGPQLNPDQTIQGHLLHLSGAFLPLLVKGGVLNSMVSGEVKREAV